jgi:glycosyltransferase involved in cell wall biosynthesis
LIAQRKEAHTMPHQPGVTITIPNWNHEILLPRSITSALQAVALLRAERLFGEVLVVDDHSRDGSLSLLRKLEALHYADGLRVLAFGSNGGLVASRNQGMLNGRFPYIIFLDADNELIPENVLCFVRTLQQTRAAAAYGNLLMRSVTSRCAHNIISNESMQPKIFNGNYVDAFAIFDRLQILDVGGYQYDSLIQEDHEMWMHLAANGRRIVFVPLVLGYYYLLPNSMCQVDDKSTRVGQNRVDRVFNQLRVRPSMRMNTQHLRYHPAVGYL